MVDDCIKLDSNTCTYIVSSSANFYLELTYPHIWTLYFDGFRNKEGACFGCLLVDSHDSKMMIACYLQFECTNNVVEYKALVQGLRKVLDLQVKCINVFGESQIVT